MGATLDRAKLHDANLEQANLEGARLIGSVLDGANLARAQLKDAVLDGADLGKARNLTQWQLDRACGDAATKLPEGLTIRRAPRPCVIGMAYTPCATAERTVKAN